jgi:hypothetical protein
MPICFDVYIFPREQEFEGEKTFLQLIELFENTSIPLTHDWGSFKIHGNELNRYVFESSKINTTEEIRKYFSRPRRKQPQKYSVETGLWSSPSDLASEDLPDAIQTISTNTMMDTLKSASFAIIHTGRLVIYPMVTPIQRMKPFIRDCSICERSSLR